jgi:hypothetical protein
MIAATSVHDLSYGVSLRPAAWQPHDEIVGEIRDRSLIEGFLIINQLGIYAVRLIIVQAQQRNVQVFPKLSKVRGKRE